MLSSTGQYCRDQRYVKASSRLLFQDKILWGCRQYCALKYGNNHEITGAISQKNAVCTTVSVFQQIHLYKSPEELCLDLVWKVFTRSCKTSSILLSKSCSNNTHYTMICNVLTYSNKIIVDCVLLEKVLDNNFRKKHSVNNNVKLLILLSMRSSR